MSPGNSTADGDNFMGCGDQELPEAPPEVGNDERASMEPRQVCGMPKDRGPERDFVVRWAFDMEYGGCSRFWWGGEVRQRHHN